VNEDPVTVPLPEARLGRSRPSRLKDRMFLNELGAAMMFLGLFLMFGGILRQGAEERTSDPFSAHVLLGAVYALFVFAVGSGIMTFERLITGGEKPRSFLRHLGAMLASFALATTTVTLLASGITRLIPPLQLFFGWLGLTAGFTTLHMTRPKRSDR